MLRTADPFPLSARSRRCSTTSRSLSPISKSSSRSTPGPFESSASRGLKRHPEAFGASWDEEAALPLAEIERRLAEGTVFGAFAAGELVGVAGLLVPGAAKKRHKGVLWGVYVRAGVRGGGLGTRLVRAVIAHARGRVEQLDAAVVTDNAPARRLYQKLGFRPYGLEPRAVKVAERFYDQELLVLMLDR